MMRESSSRASYEYWLQFKIFPFKNKEIKLPPMLCTAFDSWHWFEEATLLDSYFHLASPKRCAAGLGSGSGPGATMRSYKEVPAGHLARDSWKIWPKRPCKSAGGDPGLALCQPLVPSTQESTEMWCGTLWYPGDAHMLESSPPLWRHNLSIRQCWSWGLPYVLGSTQVSFLRRM